MAPNPHASRTTLRQATSADKAEILALSHKSQAATGMPDPTIIPPEQLESWIYTPRVRERFVAIRSGRIVGHAVIEEPNPGDLPIWRQSAPKGAKLLELGGAFVDPNLAKQGIWTKLLEHRLQLIRDQGAVPVSATWMQNEHVKRVFKAHGGTEIAVAPPDAPIISLFIFL